MKKKTKREIADDADAPPELTAETLDPEIEKRNKETITKEIEKKQSRREIIFPLMKAIFSPRGYFMIHDAKSVEDAVEEFL